MFQTKKVNPQLSHRSPMQMAWRLSTSEHLTGALGVSISDKWQLRFPRLSSSQHFRWAASNFYFSSYVSV